VPVFKPLFDAFIIKKTLAPHKQLLSNPEGKQLDYGKKTQPVEASFHRPHDDHQLFFIKSNF
jgi:hypothetical protein